MSVRAKFLILIIGITVIPIVSVMLIFAFQTGLGYWEGSESTQDVATHLVQQKWVRAHLRPALESGALESVAWDEGPARLQMAVLDPEGLVLHSTTPAIQSGLPYPQGSVDPGIEVQLLSYQDNTTGETAYVVFHSPKADWLSASHMEGWLGLIIPVILLAFASIMSFAILRSIRRSLHQLDEAASRIAQGDLEFQLEAKGNDEIASLTRSFETMRQKVKEEYARRARFIMGVSHDLKTPLALIEGYADAIAEGYADNPEKMERYLGIIKSKSKLLEGRILQLIEFVKMEAGQWKATHVATDLERFLSGLAKRWSEDGALFGVRMTYSVDIPPTTMVNMDPGLVTRALENVVHNAFRYSGDEKEAHLKAVVVKDSVRLEVVNAGPGITAEEMEHVFEPFYRGTNSRQDDGMGLGLATVKSILESHGWTVEVDSVPGSRTVFRIIIPLQTQQAKSTS